MLQNDAHGLSSFCSMGNETERPAIRFIWRMIQPSHRAPATTEIILRAIRNVTNLCRPLAKSTRSHFKTRKGLKLIKIWSYVLAGPETKNNCADEGQQKCTGLYWASWATISTERYLPKTSVLYYENYSSSLSLNNSALLRKDLWGSGRVDPCIFTLGSSWNC
jgi:hypothetical protein